jgi:RNA 3'-terminal phosphate cyclase (ATP)
MFEIDGSRESGSGTILRLSVALSALAGEGLHIYNIRQNRPQPGLRPQHLETVLTAARICGAKTEGVKLNSRELWFTPAEIRSGNFEAEIGTAGSIPMLLIAVLPICFFAKAPISLHVVKGGTDVPNSPTISFLQNVLLPTLEKMNLHASISVHRYGYYPKGNGEITLRTVPHQSVNPIHLETFGKIVSIRGISVCTCLSDRKVAERQAQAAIRHLSMNGFEADIQIINDSSNLIQKGSSIVLVAETDTGAILGADAIGELRKTAEAVGQEVAERLTAEMSANATVDTHLADMLIPYMAFTKSTSLFQTRKFSDHMKANIWLAKTMLNVDFVVTEQKGLYKVQKE